ncbi:hypothetical protein BHE74_00000263 [Ensete ventricosum]|nr:hypothetical protein BHE74_00000263 [Ensete ventricosum]
MGSRNCDRFAWWFSLRGRSREVVNPSPQATGYGLPAESRFPFEDPYWQVMRARDNRRQGATYKRVNKKRLKTATISGNATAISIAKRVFLPFRHIIQSSRSRANSLANCWSSHEERDSEQDKHEVWYPPRVKEVQSGVPIGKMSHKDRLTMMETRLDILEASLEEFYQGQGRILGIESLQEEAKSLIDKVESLIDRLTEDTKDSIRHLHEVVMELTAKVTLLTRTLNAGGKNTRAAPPQSFRAPKPHCYEGTRDAKEFENFLFDIE